MLSMVRSGIGFTVGAVVFYGDVVTAFALALLYGAVGAGVMGVPWLLAVASALVVGVGVWCIVRAVPRSRPLKTRLEGWAYRVDDWIAPPVALPVVPLKPVDPLAFLLERAAAPSVPAPVRESQSTEPRPLTSAELASWKCWRCGETAVEGTHAWEDRGPYQLLSNHALKCPNGHRWTNSTDGG